MRWIVLIAALALGSCNLVVDFDDTSDLPCGCLPDHVCLVNSDTCVLKGSTDLFKSCSTDTPDGTGDDLCPTGSKCVDHLDRGHRCLPTCAPSNFSTPEAGIHNAQQCTTTGTLCWDTPRGGVCDEGECSDLPNNCPPPQRCVVFNGAGKCFTPCNIYLAQECGGDTTCHPIGQTAITGCVETGTLQMTQSCSDTVRCAKFDNASGRRLVCGTPLQSDAPAQCWSVCAVGDGSRCGPGESCFPFRADTEPTTMTQLGICTSG